MKTGHGKAPLWVEAIAANTLLHAFLFPPIKCIEEYEYSLVRLEKVESKKVELINDDLFGETITGYSIS